MSSTLSRIDEQRLDKAVELALANIEKGGEPFGALLANDQGVIADGVNETYIDHDSTAHAEIQALRHASKLTGKPDHPGTTMYASGKPCAMCMAAMIQAGVSRIVFAADDDLGAPYGWSTEPLYQRMQQAFGNQGVTIIHHHHDGNRTAFERYRARHGLGKNDNLKSDEPHA